MREDVEMLEDMKINGWTPDYHSQDKLHKRFDLPLYGISFVKGTIHIWSAKQGWQVAELVEGSYQNHRGQVGHSIQPYKDRFPDTSGYIPDLKTVLELDNNLEL